MRMKIPLRRVFYPFFRVHMLQRELFIGQQRRIFGTIANFSTVFLANTRSLPG